MTSKEALKDIFDILINLERLSDLHDEQDIKKQKFEIIEKDLDRLEIYEKFTIPNLRNLILKLYNSEELTREEHEIIFEIMSLKNKELE